MLDTTFSDYKIEFNILLSKKYNMYGEVWFMNVDQKCISPNCTMFLANKYNFITKNTKIKKPCIFFWNKEHIFWQPVLPHR